MHITAPRDDITKKHALNELHETIEDKMRRKFIQYGLIATDQQQYIYVHIQGGNGTNDAHYSTQK